MKKTLILGASSNPERASYRAVHQLKHRGIPLIAIGAKEGEIHGEKILTGMPHFEDIHTVTLYLGEKNQKQYYNYTLSLNPERIIFNPGAENDELSNLAAAKGIEVTEACTLVMLSLRTY
jgi:uncharacterized protein